MNDILDVALIVAFFAFAIWLVNVLGRMIERGGADEIADEPPDTAGRAGTAGFDRTAGFNGVGGTE